MDSAERQKGRDAEQDLAGNDTRRSHAVRLRRAQITSIIIIILSAKGVENHPNWDRLTS